MQTIAALTVNLLTPTPSKAIYNGTSALNSPYIVQVSLKSALCSGILVQPQILATAAHCLIKRGVVDPPDSISIYEPGVDTSVSKTVARGLAAFTPSGYYNDTDKVEPNDIAFIVLDKRVGSTPELKLANFDLFRTFVSGGVPLTAFGYGRTSQNQRTSIPLKMVARPTQQRKFLGFAGYERTYVNYVADENGSTCAGDSGGPTIADYNGSVYLVSIHAGSRGPCSSDPDGGEWGSTGMIAGEYQNLYSQAVSYLQSKKPGQVLNPQITLQGSQALLSWMPPSQNAASVAKYVVLDSSQTEVCSTQSNSCNVNVSSGVNNFTIYASSVVLRSDPTTFTYELKIPKVESVNVSNDSLQGLISWAMPNDPGKVITEFLVLNGQGMEVCRVVNIQSCKTNLSIGENTFRIVAISGKNQSEPTQFNYNLKNAALPSIDEVRVKESKVELVFAPLSDLGNTRASSIQIRVTMDSVLNSICTIGSTGGTCSLPYKQAIHSIYLSLSSDLGTLPATQILNWSGIDATRTVKASKLRLNTLLKNTKNLAIFNPGYASEISELSDAIPKINDDLVYDSELEETINLLANVFEDLKIQTINFPRKITIICAKGKLTKKATGVNPRCPSGYKRK